MKKILNIFIGVILLFSFSACAQSKKAIDVITQAQKASEGINSMRLAMTMDATLSKELANSNQGQTLHIVTNGASMMRPIKLHLNTTLKMKNKSYTIEMYETPDTIYMLMPIPGGNGAWVKLDNKQGQALVNQQKPADPTQALNEIKKFSDEMAMKESGDSYVLIFKGKGDKLNQFIKETLQKQMPDVAKQMQDKLKNINYKDVSYQYIINKKTYYPEEMKVKLTLSIKDPSTGKSGDITEDFDVKYSDFNKVKVSIPESVISHAKPANQIMSSSNLSQQSSK